jgi:hypothetical protein
VVSPELQRVFEQAGWAATGTEDGSLILRRIPGPEPQQAPSGVEAENDMWDRLRARGWRVEQDSDGSRLLYPPSPEKGPASVLRQAPASPRPGDSGKEKSLEDLLEQRGWRAERSVDGSLILRPRENGREVAPASGLEVSPAEGFVPAEVGERGIDLPVDQWREVKRIAGSWLNVFGDGEMVVGKIRKVLRVYVVSIVERDPPHRLRHQIAVNAADGRVVVLN